MSYAKNYDPGKIRMDLPTSNYIYELPLLSFSDIHGAVNLSLIFNYRMKEEQGNPFHIAPGYKLNLQKQLIMGTSGPTALQEEDGKCTDFISTGGVYVLDNDDQRILRRSGTTYVLENMDYSKEIYDSTGKIVSAYDKYGNVILSYEYDSGAHLTSVTYRSSKTITCSYFNGQLTRVSYAGYGAGLEYDFSVDNEVYITHYTGVMYSLVLTSDAFSANSDSPWMNFRATAFDNSHTGPSYIAELTRTGINQVTISQKVDDEFDNLGNTIITVDATTYDFSNYIQYNRDHGHIEVTNNTGVKTRFQYQGRDLCCSYEVTGSDVSFDEYGKHIDSIQLHKTMDETDNSQASGMIAFENGMSLSYDNSQKIWFVNVNYSYKPDVTGYYLLTGWMRNVTTNQDASGRPLYISTPSPAGEIAFYPQLMPNQKWTFFAYKFYLEADNILYIRPEIPGLVEMKDFRLAFYSAKDLSHENVKAHFVYAHVCTDILIANNGTENVILPLDECSFRCGATQLADKGVASFNDLMKYKCNKKKGLNTTEFYCNHGKDVHTVVATAPIAVDCADNTYDLSNCNLGRRTYSRKGIDLEKIVDNSDDYFMVHYALKANGTVGSYQVMDDNMDVICTSIDSIITNYTRDQDLITAETVPNLYTRTTTYSTDSSGNPVITATDEFGKATQYTLDKTWGNVKQVLLPDGSTITDTYDGDMCTLTKRTFGNSSGRSNSLFYDRGNLSGLQGGNLSYNFTYTDVTKLASVVKNTAPVEDHTYNDDDTNIKSYYPSQGAPLHTTDSTYDAYGRLSSIAGVLTNTYDAWPEFNSDTGELQANGSGRNALLATSTDELRGETARFTYDENNSLLKKKEVTSQNSYATKISTEEVEYDALNRLTKDTCNYQGINTVISEIVYQTEKTDPNVDSRVKTYTFKVNSTTTPAAVTQTSYDTYKRLKQKKYTIGNKTFTRSFVYSKTRLDYQWDSVGGTTDISHDACGRIIKDSAGDYTTRYTYDQYGQLTRENNQALAKSFVYEYNNDGCLTAIKTYNYTTGALSGTPVTTTFGYDEDKLTNFNGTAIAYNAIGCPTTYDGKSAYWVKGKLSTLSKGSRADGLETYSYSYNAYGQRVSKSYSYMPGTSGPEGIYVDMLLNSNKQFYYDHSGRLIAEVTARTYQSTGAQSERIVFLYDGNTVIGMQHTIDGVTTPYYFHRNPLGDVVGIYDTNSNLVAKYIYDAWGNCTISGNTTVAKANPIRYRGYYYDDDTGLYYCNARYYSPKWRRFISPETCALNPYAVNGLNTYVYADNNPVEIAHFHLNACGRALNTYASATTSTASRANTNSMWLTVPSWLRYLSKANDIFAAGSHSYIVSKYLFQNLGFLDEMRMLGANPATALGKLPQASYLTKIGIAFSLLDAGIVFYDNLAQGNSFAEATLDGLLTFGKGALSSWIGGAVGTNVGGLIGASLGSLIPIPGVGTVVGFVAGTAVGMLTAWFVDDILGYIKDGLLEWIFD